MRQRHCLPAASTNACCGISEVLELVGDRRANVREEHGVEDGFGNKCAVVKVELDGVFPPVINVLHKLHHRLPCAPTPLSVNAHTGFTLLLAIDKQTV